MHSAVVSSASTPTTGKNKFDAQFTKAIKRPQHFPYGDSSGTTSTSGSGSGSGIDSVPSSRQALGHVRSDSGSNSDSRSRSRSLSPLRRQEALQDQDELLSSDDSGPTTTKYRRLSDPSGASRMETDSRKSLPTSVASSRYSSTYNRHPPRDVSVMTSSMHGTESVSKSICPRRD